MARSYRVAKPSTGTGKADVLFAGGGRRGSLKIPQGTPRFEVDMNLDEAREKTAHQARVRALAAAGYDSSVLAHMDMPSVSKLFSGMADDKLKEEEKAEALAEERLLGGLFKGLMEEKGGRPDPANVDVLRSLSEGITDIPGRDPFKGTVERGEDELGGRLHEEVGAVDLPDPWDPALGREVPGQKFLIDESTGMYVDPTSGDVFESREKARTGEFYEPDEGESLSGIRGRVGITENIATEEELADFRSDWVEANISKLPKESQIEARKRLASQIPDRFFANTANLTALQKFFDLGPDKPYDKFAPQNRVMREIERKGRKVKVYNDIRSGAEIAEFDMGPAKGKEKTLFSGYDAKGNPIVLFFDKTTGKFKGTEKWPEGTMRRLPAAARPLSLNFTMFLAEDDDWKKFVTQKEGVVFDPYEWWTTGDKKKRDAVLKFKTQSRDQAFIKFIEAMQEMAGGMKKPSVEPTGDTDEEGPTIDTDRIDRALKLLKEKRKNILEGK